MPARDLRVDHDVSALTRFGAVHGRVTLLRHVPVSDWLLHGGGFLAVQSCRLQAIGDVGLRKSEPLVFVNAEHVVGVTDDTPMTDAEIVAEAAAHPAAPKPGASPR